MRCELRPTQRHRFKFRLSYVYCERRYIPGARTAYTFHDEELDMAFTTGSSKTDLATLGDFQKIIAGLGGVLVGIGAVAGLLGAIGGAGSSQPK